MPGYNSRTSSSWLSEGWESEAHPGHKFGHERQGRWAKTRRRLARLAVGAVLVTGAAVGLDVAIGGPSELVSSVGNRVSAAADYYNPSKGLSEPDRPTSAQETREQQPDPREALNAAAIQAVDRVIQNIIDEQGPNTVIERSDAGIYGIEQEIRTPSASDSDTARRITQTLTYDSQNGTLIMTANGSNTYPVTFQTTTAGVELRVPADSLDLNNGQMTLEQIRDMVRRPDVTADYVTARIVDFPASYSDAAEESVGGDLVITHQNVLTGESSFGVVPTTPDADHPVITGEEAQRQVTDTTQALSAATIILS